MIAQSQSTMMRNDTMVDNAPPPAAAELPQARETWRGVRLRWWGLGAGVLAGIFDTVLLSSLGVSFAVNGWDGRPLIAAYFGSSFAVLGYLFGALLESQRRERRSNAVVQAQTELIAATRARLAQSEKLAALGQLAATVAHEVRNPLGVMRSAAQTLSETLPAEHQAAQASTFIITEIDRLANVVNSLLAFARPLQLDARPVRVAELFERAVLLVRDELEAKRVRVDRHLGTALPAVQVDPDLLSQVLIGLLANAVEAVPAGGAIALDAYASDGAVQLSIADSGPGIAPDIRGRIFEPFFTTRPRGTGLGLAIARQIVEAHGGRIEVGAASDGGARFTLTLPAARSTALAA
jgi:two-component system sensor histidine kinase HydH